MMNFEKIGKLTSFIIFYTIICSALKHKIYYLFFRIDIIDYLNLSEYIGLFMDDILRYTIISIIFIILILYLEENLKLAKEKHFKSIKKELNSIKEKFKSVEKKIKEKYNSLKDKGYSIEDEYNLIQEKDKSIDEELKSIKHSINEDEKAIDEDFESIKKSIEEQSKSIEEKYITEKDDFSHLKPLRRFYRILTSIVITLLIIVAFLPISNSSRWDYLNILFSILIALLYGLISFSRKINWIYYLAAIFLLQPSLNGISKVYKIKENKESIIYSITHKEEVITTNDSIKYLGNTENYIFLHNINSKKTRIIKSNDISEINLKPR